jgi:hypothetical protein
MTQLHQNCVRTLFARRFTAIPRALGGNESEFTEETARIANEIVELGSQKQLANAALQYKGRVIR